MGTSIVLSRKGVLVRAKWTTVSSSTFPSNEEQAVNANYNPACTRRRLAYVSDIRAHAIRALRHETASNFGCGSKGMDGKRVSCVGATTQRLSDVQNAWAIRVTFEYTLFFIFLLYVLKMLRMNSVHFNELGFAHHACKPIVIDCQISTASA